MWQHKPLNTWNSRFLHLLRTRSWALLLVFPEVNSTSPLMSGQVGLKVILWTVSIFSRRTRALCCSGSPFRLHAGALRTDLETSHSKRASSGATTSTSFSSLTIDRGRAGEVHKRGNGSEPTPSYELIFDSDESFNLSSVAPEQESVSALPFYFRAPALVITISNMSPLCIYRHFSQQSF